MVMTTYEHIDPGLRHVLGLSDRERLAFLDRPILQRYPAGDEILKQLERLLEIPKRPRMGNLLIVGESNNGKTTLIEKFHGVHGKPSINLDNKPVKPIIIAEAPPTADEKSLYLSILDRFHAPHRPTDPVTRLRFQTIHLLRECQTRMLMIDEIHSVLTGTSRKRAEVMNAIKFLCNELRIPIVAVGTRVAVQVLHGDPQHASRFEVAVLPKWKLNRDFQKLLVGFQETLPLKKASNLAAKEMAQRLYAISTGNLGDLRELLVACARKAIETGTERITPEIVESMKWFRPTEAHGIRVRESEELTGQYL